MSRPFLWALAMLGAGFSGSALYHAAFAPVAVAAEAGPAGEIRATRFVLVNEQGETRGIIGQYSPVYAAGDEDPPDAKEMTGIVIYDENGEPGVQLGRGGEVSRLEMHGDVGWLTLGVHQAGSGIGIWVPEETLRLGAGVQLDGSGGFVVRDIKKRDRLSGGMPPNAGISMSLIGDDGKATWSAP